MRSDERIRLRHMLDAAREAMRSSSTRTRESLERDRVWTLGLVKCVEIIGEAAAKVSVETQGECPQIPWAQIVAMRNRLVHAYFDIDLDQVWKTVNEDLPPLAKELGQILDREGDG